MAHYVNSYIKDNYGFSFRDSSYKRYNRYHCGGDTFNIFSGNTFVGGGHCGGGNFWAGLGAGLGAGLCNWLGGFGFGGFGGSWGNFGGGWNPWAQAGNARTGNTGNSCKCNCGNGTKELVYDIDNAKISKAIKDIQAFKKLPEKERTSAKYDEIKKYIEKAIEDTDNIAKKEDLETYKNLLADLESVKPAGSNADKDKVKKDDDGVKPDGTTPDGNKPDGTTPDAKPGEITINGKPIKLDDLTFDNLKELDKLKNDEIKAAIDKITPEEAKKILTRLGYIDNNGNGKISNSYSVLLLLAKSGVNVEVEHNGNAEDNWIKGPITNIDRAEDGKLSYTVDCEKTGLRIKGKYRISAKDKSNQKYQIDDKHSDTKFTNGSRLKPEGNEFTFKGEKIALENETGDVAITTK